LRGDGLADLRRRWRRGDASLQTGDGCGSGQRGRSKHGCEDEYLAPIHGRWSWLIAHCNGQK
jgi:hypothetical protein